MTLDEAIKHCEEVAEKKEEDASWFWDKEGNPNYENCVECASEHRQLAEWLKELKAYREILANADKIIESEYGCVIVEGYADVIDQMKEVYKRGKR